MAEDEKNIQEKYYRNGGNLMKLPNGNVRTLAIILALLLCTSFTGIVSAEALIQGNRVGYSAPIITRLPELGLMWENLKTSSSLGN